MLSSESRYAALIARRVTLTQVSDLLPMERLAVVSYPCKDFRADISAASTAPWQSSPCRRAGLVSRCKQQTVGVCSGCRVQRLKDSDPFLGALWLSTTSKVWSGGGPDDWRDWPLSTNTTSVCLPCILASRHRRPRWKENRARVCP